MYALTGPIPATSYSAKREGEKETLGRAGTKRSAEGKTEKQRAVGSRTKRAKVSRKVRSFVRPYSRRDPKNVYEKLVSRREN